MDPQLAAVKEAIKELPLQQRAVAVALKKIFDQIKLLDIQQQQQIQENHLKFTDQFKEIEKSMNAVIQGKNLKDEELVNPQKYFLNSEKADLQKIKSSGKKIDRYWAVCLKNFYGEELNELDSKIFEYIQKIETNVTTTDLEITFEFSQNPLFEAGSFKRVLSIQNGKPTKYSGATPKWLTKVENEGMMKQFILENSTDEERNITILDFFHEFINNVIPYSLEFYLGLPQEQDFQEIDDEEADEEEEDSEEEEDGQNGKKAKQ